MINLKIEIQGPIATATFFTGNIIHVLLEYEYAQRNWVFQNVHNPCQGYWKSECFQ